MGLKGTESPDELDGNAEKMEIIQKIRRKCAFMTGLSKTENEAPMNTPRIGIVTSPKDYISLDKSNIEVMIKILPQECFQWEKLIKLLWVPLELILELQQQ